MIERRRLCAIGGLALFSAHRTGWAQMGATMRRVGVMLTPSQAASSGYIAAFKQGMGELGWQEGRNVEYRIAYANGDPNRFDDLARELVAQKVEVLLTSTATNTSAAHNAAPSLPIVMASVSNVIQNGFVASLARPGGSITGLTVQSEDLHAKVIEVLHQMVPGAIQVAVLLSGGNSDLTDAAWVGTQSACATLGLRAQRFVANDPGQIAIVVEQVIREHSQAVVVPANGMYFAERVPLQALLRTARLPSAYQFREHAQAGGLFSYGANLIALFRYAARYVDKILKGADPAVLPIEQPIAFELVINLKTAKALGVTMPQSLLLRADEVIE